MMTRKDVGHLTRPKFFPEDSVRPGESAKEKSDINSVGVIAIGHRATPDHM